MFLNKRPNGYYGEMSFFAPAEIHQQIVAHELCAGSEFILHKKAAQNGKRITGELVFEAVPRQVPVKPVNGNGTDRFKDIMRQCLEDAVEITRAVEGVPFQAEDLRSICSCLFIARKAFAFKATPESSPLSITASFIISNTRLYH
jgi:hypothetical protein